MLLGNNANMGLPSIYQTHLQFSTVFNNPKKIVIYFLRSRRDVGGAEGRGRAEGGQVQGEGELHVAVVLAKATEGLLKSETRNIFFILSFR